MKSNTIFTTFGFALIILLGLGVVCPPGIAAAQYFGEPPRITAPQLIKDINPNGSSILTQFDETQIFAIDDIVYFPAEGELGGELWRSDGTFDGTRMVKNINPDYADSDPHGFANLGGTLFFVADDNVHGKEVWSSDGTAASTKMLADVNPTGPANPASLTAVGDTLYFVANDGMHAYELWKSDGTTAGTKMVKEITPGNELKWPFVYQNHLVDLNGKLIFTSYGGTSQYDWDLWVSDGSPTGTMLIKDFYGSMLENQTVIDDQLYFTVFQDRYGSELWKTDGTAAGTVLVKDINPTKYDGSDPANLIAFNGTLYFSADDGVHGAELWKSDGTEGGTVMIKNIHPTGGSMSKACSKPPCTANIGNILYFAADDGSHGLELWKSDGTSQGTALVKDLRSGADGNPGLLTAAGNKLFFVVTNNNDGSLWMSDGTTEGSQMLKYYSGYAPALLTPAGDRLFFAADDGTNLGKELWGVYLSDLKSLYLPLALK